MIRIPATKGTMKYNDATLVSGISKLNRNKYANAILPVQINTSIKNTIQRGVYFLLKMIQSKDFQPVVPQAKIKLNTKILL